MLETVFFWLIAAFTVVSATFVVTAHNLFRSAMGLTSVLVGIAGLYLLMDAQFLSAIQIAVYVGGVVVLIVFAVLMVADVTQKVFLSSGLARRLVAAGAGAALFALVTGAIRALGFRAAAAAPRAASVEELGRALLEAGPGGYVLPFEVISLVLVAALVGAITVAGGRDEDEGEGR
jgi:NADH-quinone oxidoreductase subunit J